MLERLVPSVVDRVLEDAPCQVALVYGRIDRSRISRVTVPVTKGANATLAARLSPAFTEWFGAGLRVVTVVDRALTDEDAALRVSEARSVVQEAELTQELDVLRRGDPARGLLRSIGEGELVVIGAPSMGSVVPLIGQTIPALIASRNLNPVIVVRALEEHRARLLDDVFFSRN